MTILLYKTFCPRGVNGTAPLQGPSSSLKTSVLASLPRLVPRYMLLSLSLLRLLART